LTSRAPTRWVRPCAPAQPSLTDGLEAVELHTVDGGRILTAASTGGDWRLVVS